MKIGSFLILFTLLSAICLQFLSLYNLPFNATTMQPSQLTVPPPDIRRNGATTRNPYVTAPTTQTARNAAQANRNSMTSPWNLESLIPRPRPNPSPPNNQLVLAAENALTVAKRPPPTSTTLSAINRAAGRGTPSRNTRVSTRGSPDPKRTKTNESRNTEDMTDSSQGTLDDNTQEEAQEKETEPTTPNLGIGEITVETDGNTITTPSTITGASTNRTTLPTPQNRNNTQAGTLPWYGRKHLTFFDLILPLKLVLTTHDIPVQIRNRLVEFLRILQYHDPTCALIRIGKVRLGSKPRDIWEVPEDLGESASSFGEWSQISDPQPSANPCSSRL